MHPRSVYLKRSPRSVKTNINTKDAAYRTKSTNPDHFHLAKYGLRKAITDAERAHKDRIEQTFEAGNAKEVWANIEAITQYKGAKRSAKDDTTVSGLILKDDESGFRKEVDVLIKWCADNNLILNVNNTKKLIVNFRKNKKIKEPLIINGVCVEQIERSPYQSRKGLEKIPERKIEPYRGFEPAILRFPGRVCDHYTSSACDSQK
ncbi:hypothetical protein HOLleu_24088 [Holothuria leucospilota]|uniref:Uncharacterized protein n=1 Tax=Holothuria leucospilota TaxID=206669 RepID=A0A9Q1BVY4_HOLLE|nr:hypothetical protein HOLleu_24088 [Holothuria leucospilota]